MGQFVFFYRKATSCLSVPERSKNIAEFVGGCEEYAIFVGKYERVFTRRLDPASRVKSKNGALRREAGFLPLLEQLVVGRNIVGVSFSQQDTDRLKEEVNARKAVTWRAITLYLSHLGMRSSEPAL